jgi:hypothetical protein
MESLKKQRNNKVKNCINRGIILKFLWFGALSLIAIIPSVLAVLYSPVDPDSSYYLSVVERINEGYKLYVDLKIGYTPLYFYFLLGLKKIFNIGISYEFYLSVHFVLQYFAAYIIYKISYGLTQEKSYSFYSSLLFVMMSHWNEGNAVLLETPSLLLGILGLHLMLSNQIKKTTINLLVGFLFVLSFLVKQYGLGFSILGLCYFVFSKRGFNSFIYFILGFILPLILILIINKPSFLEVISGSGYGRGWNIVIILEALIRQTIYLFTRVSPVLIFTLFCSIKVYKNKIQRIRLVILTLGIFGFMLQFLFASFHHYYLYVIPFISILIFFVYNNITKYKKIYTGLIILTFLLSIYSTYYNRVFKIYFIESAIKHEQKSLANQINVFVPRGSRLYIADIGLIPIYYLSDRLPPNLKSIGYSFGKALKPEEHLRQIESADFVLKYKHEYNDFNLNTNKVRNELKKLRFIELDNYALLYNK